MEDDGYDWELEEDYEPDYCAECNGTGENGPGHKCKECDGTGEQP